MTDRLATRFAACKAQGRAALITFVTAGDPDVAATPAILDALVAGGADIEIPLATAPSEQPPSAAAAASSTAEHTAADATAHATGPHAAPAPAPAQAEAEARAAEVEATAALFGGAQYYRLMREFRAAVQSLPRHEPSQEEVRGRLLSRCIDS